jgi:integrase
MSESHPTAPAKPSKPCPDFPLFPHAAGVWAKKIRGKLYYFGPWSDPDGALKKYLAEKDDLHAGRKPRPGTEALTVKELANAFLNHKRDLRDAGELSPRTWDDYKAAAVLVVAQFGKSRLVDDIGPDDFAELRNKLAKKWGPVRVGNVIQRVRSMFKFAADNGLVERPTRYGQGFKRPSKKTLRLERKKKGPRMFEAAEIRDMVGGALVVGENGPELVQPGVQLKAMILLGINCGFGNADCGTLPLAAVDLAGGWLNYHRPKTGIDRRCPLWPETVEALKQAIAKRPNPKDPADAGLVFVTKYGGCWAKETSDSTLSKEMRKLLDALGINGNRNFYALRHVFETIGGEAKDQIAVDSIMGHAREDMASVYRERISDERLKAVTDHVRNWLFALPKDAALQPDAARSAAAGAHDMVCNQAAGR